MPIALDPNQTVDVCLDSDKDKPESERPTFVFRHLTYRQRREVDRLLAEAEKVEREDTEKALDFHVAAIRVGLIGWRNMGALDYGPDVEPPLTFWEAFELAYNYPHKLSISETEKKARSSPSPSTTESSTASQPSPNPSS